MCDTIITNVVCWELAREGTRVVYLWNVARAIGSSTWKIAIGVRSTEVAGAIATPVGVTTKTLGNTDFISLNIQSLLIQSTGAAPTDIRTTTVNMPTRTRIETESKRCREHPFDYAMMLAPGISMWRQDYTKLKSISMVSVSFRFRNIYAIDFQVSAMRSV